MDDERIEQAVNAIDQLFRQKHKDSDVAYILKKLLAEERERIADWLWEKRCKLSDDGLDNEAGLVGYLSNELRQMK